MKDAVVTKDTLTAIAAAVETEAVNTNVIQSIAAREPLLAAFIADQLVTISGKLSLSGAPPEIVQRTYEDVASLVATSVRAVWAGTDELWRGIDLGDLTRRRPRRRRAGRTAPAPEGPRAAPGAA